MLHFGPPAIVIAITSVYGVLILPSTDQKDRIGSGTRRVTGTANRGSGGATISERVGVLGKLLTRLIGLAWGAGDVLHRAGAGVR